MAKTPVAPDLIVSLAQSGKYTTQKCVADRVGLSRERVRQVLAQRGVRFGQQKGKPLSWPCPECNQKITRPYGQRNYWKHMPAHCRSCASNYCRRGHRIYRDGGRRCKACERLRNTRVVRIRVCPDCRLDVPVTVGSERVAKSRQGAPKRCRPCQARRSSRERAYGRGRVQDLLSLLR